MQTTNQNQQGAEISDSQKSEAGPLMNDGQEDLTAIKKIIGNNRRVYISGPISGYPDLNAPAFENGEKLLKAIGAQPINPLKVVDLSVFKTPLSPEDEWAYCMKADLKEMYGCGAVILLDNWKKSPGATWEYFNALVLKIPVFNHRDLTMEVLTEAERVELFCNITKKIEANHAALIKELYR